MQKIWIVGVVVVAAVVIGAAIVLTGGEPARERQQASVEPKPTVVAQAGIDNPKLQPSDRILGREDAPVTIIEYSSLTCPHCASFHREGFKHLKEAYINTGKVRLVYRDFPLDRIALHAAALAECLPVERYFGFLEVLFAAQADFRHDAADPVGALTRLGRLAGLSETKAVECMSSEERENAIIAERLAGDAEFDIESTPTFIINGRKYPGVLTVGELDAILKPLVR